MPSCPGRYALLPVPSCPVPAIPPGRSPDGTFSPVPARPRPAPQPSCTPALLHPRPRHPSPPAPQAPAPLTPAPQAKAYTLKRPELSNLAERPEGNVMRIAVVTGNPKPASRTHDLASFVAATIDGLTGFDEPPVDAGLAEYAPRVVD